MSLFVAIVVHALAAGPASNTPLDVPASPVRVRQAVQGALGYLEQEGATWINEKKCAACHHAPQMIWAMNEARNNGYAANGEMLATTTVWSHEPDNRAKLFGDPGKYTGVNMGAVYLALATESAAALDPPVQEGLTRLVNHIVEKQAADGSWTGPEGRPPLFDDQESVTLLATLALPAPSSEAAGAPTAASRERSLKWLSGRPAGETNQVRALRLACAVKAARPEAEIKAAIDLLLARQNPDGGWSQTAAMPSDAFGTGQALYALRRAGVTQDHPAVQRGAAFLLATQSPDGAWPMASRPAKPGGAGAGNLKPIGFTGTSWGVIGLVNAVPNPSP